MSLIVALLSLCVLFLIPGVYQAGGGPRAVFAASTEETPSGAKKGAPTASDQSENAADLKITQQIRQAVVKDDSLSTSAQNVTIVTRDGKVTLRGTVKSQQEKQKIADKAKQAAGVKGVDNQIFVKQ